MVTVIYFHLIFRVQFPLCLYYWTFDTEHDHGASSATAGEEE